MHLGISEAFDLRPNYIINIIHQSGAKIVGFQLPEGLKKKGVELAKKVEESTGVEVFISETPALGRAT